MSKANLSIVYLGRNTQSLWLKIALRSPATVSAAGPEPDPCLRTHYAISTDLHLQ